mgnify:CR=1 FL=1
MSRSIEPCLCGDTDCPRCGSRQGTYRREEIASTCLLFADGAGGSVRLCRDCGRKEAMAILHPEFLRGFAEEIEPGQEVECEGCGVVMRNEGREVREEPCHAMKRSEARKDRS